MLSDSQRQDAEVAIRELADRQLSVAEVRDVKKAFGEAYAADSQLGETLANAVLSSAGLQAKAQAKLGSGLWWVTEKSLQQATPRQVAAHKAKWFGGASVQDLCCGIGGDAIHLAHRGSLNVVDSDPTIGMMVAANLTNHGRDAVQITIGNAESQSIAPDNLLHIDPDRRSEAARTTAPQYYSPDWTTVLELVQKAAGSLIKLAPTAIVDPPTDLKSHRVWISLAGTVREQSFLTGDLVEAFTQQSGTDCSPGHHSALMIGRDGNYELFSGHVDAVADEASKPSGYMIAPSKAIRAAGLTNRFALDKGLQTLGGPSGYLTGDAQEIAGAAAEPIVWTGSCDDRRLRRELRSRGMYPKRVKTRGVEHDPNKLEKKLRDCGDTPITLWIGRTGKKRYAAFTLTDI